MTSRQTRAFQRTLAGIGILFGFVACQSPAPTPTTLVPTTQAPVNPTTSEAATAAPEPERVSINVNLGGNPQTLDPVMAAPLDAPAHDLIANLFIGLTYLDPE